MESTAQQPRPPLPDRVGALIQETAAQGGPPCHALDGLLSRARGAFLGAALGDALGLPADGDDAPTVADRHPGGPNLPYRGAYGGYPSGDWTDATDMAVLTARTLGAYFRKECDDPILDLAGRLSRWNKQGFQELGDLGGVRPESVVFRAMCARDFTTRPLDAACEVKGAKAENGAMTRSIACAFTPFPEDWTETLARVTHSDPRALACAVTFALLVRAAASVPPGAALPAEAVRAPVAAGCAILEEPARRIDFMVSLTDTATLDAVAPDERDRRSYAVKTLACVMWAVRCAIQAPPAERGPEFFKRVLRAVAARGGDASANCCAVGAVLGALLGPGDLPDDWLATLPNREWLEREISGFLTATKPAWPAGGV